jgi:hypothetical protein
VLGSDVVHVALGDDIMKAEDNPPEGAVTEARSDQASPQSKPDYYPKSFGEEVRGFFLIVLPILLGLTLILGPIPVLIWIEKRLLVGPFPTRDALFFMYAAFFVLFLYELHILFVVGPRLWNIGLPKNTPKYLEYIYLAIISAGLLQIVTFPPKLGSYILTVVGDENTMLQRISNTARQLRQQCSSQNTYLTKDYCDKLTEISVSSNLGALLKSKFLDDTEFRAHAIGDRPVRWWAFWEGPKYDDMATEHRILIYSPFGVTTRKCSECTTSGTLSELRPPVEIAAAAAL